MEKEYSEMRDKYQDAISGKMNAEKLMGQIRIEFETIQRTVLTTIDNIRKVGGVDNSGVYRVERLLILFPPPAFDFLTQDMPRCVTKSMIFFPTKQ